MEVLLEALVSTATALATTSLREEITNSRLFKLSLAHDEHYFVISGVFLEAAEEPDFLQIAVTVEYACEDEFTHGEFFGSQGVPLLDDALFSLLIGLCQLGDLSLDQRDFLSNGLTLWQLHRLCILQGRVQAAESVPITANSLAHLENLLTAALSLGENLRCRWKAFFGLLGLALLLGLFLLLSLPFLFLLSCSALLLGRLILALAHIRNAWRLSRGSVRAISGLVLLLLLLARLG